MEKDYLKFVIVGHVDHGKSTLIGRLLYDCGVVPEEKINEVKTVCESLGKKFEFCFLLDYLEEERQQNITIDTTQIFFNTEKRNYVIIDAPGHKEFLKNMITGSSLAEAAILIVDITEGIKEQTKRHAYLLSLLGVKQLIVAINKMDLAEYSQEKFKQLETELQSHLNKVGLKPNFVIPISATNGDNAANHSQRMNWYQGPTILAALDSFNASIGLSHLPLRLPVQDIYQGQPVGQIESGQIKVGQEILVLPEGLKSVVLEIKKWQNPELTSAVAGENISIKLDAKTQLQRGQVICPTENLPEISDNFKATVFVMSGSALKLNEKIFLKLTTEETEMTISKIHKIIDSSTLETISRADEIRETEVAEVEISADKKIVFDDFKNIAPLGRFVIIKNEDIAGVGIITP